MKIAGNSLYRTNNSPSFGLKIPNLTSCIPGLPYNIRNINVAKDCKTFVLTSQRIIPPPFLQGGISSGKYQNYRSEGLKMVEHIDIPVFLQKILKFMIKPTNNLSSMKF